MACDIQFRLGLKITLKTLFNVQRELKWSLEEDNNMSTLFFNCEGVEERRYNSYRNISEVNDIHKLVVALLGQDIREEDIGIITPYEEQKQLLVGKIVYQSKMKKLQIANVDAFQGQEKEIILLSCVRSTPEYPIEYASIGILNNRRRLNVALTRARLLIIFGNIEKLSSNSMWENLINHHKKEGFVRKQLSIQV